MAIKYGTYWNVDFLRTVFSDLFFVLGWSPCLLFLLAAHRCVKGKVSESSLYLVMAVALAFLTVLINPYTRRIVQAVPLFFLVVTKCALRINRGLLTPLVGATLSWWGVLSLLSFYF